MNTKQKYITMGRLVEEYLDKVKQGEKISINDWAELHKKEAPKEELKEQLRMGVLLTKVGESPYPRPELTNEQRQRIKKNTLDYYDKQQPLMAQKTKANQYLSDAADAFGKQDYKTTRDLLNKATEIHLEVKNDVWLGFEYSIFGVLGILEGDFDSAIENFEKSNGFYQKTSEIKARIGVLGHLGMVYLTLNKLDQSEKSFSEMLQPAAEIDLPGAIMTALNNLGLIELARGRSLEAFELFQKTLTLAQEHKDKETQAIAYGNMAEAAENGRGHKTAIELYHKSLTLSRGGKYHRLIAGAAARLGALYASHNKLDEASQLFNEAASAIDQLRGASTEPTAVKFRRTLGSFGMPSTEEVLTDFRRRIKEEQTVMV
ncbi:MAG: tetratricopeptide repeat protein [Planctomycetes bacterium]|nr:tetratricopeptide repeat protein [Planctomycetota bacterium]